MGMAQHSAHRYNEREDTCWANRKRGGKVLYPPRVDPEASIGLFAASFGTSALEEALGKIGYSAVDAAWPERPLKAKTVSKNVFSTNTAMTLVLTPFRSSFRIGGITEQRKVILTKKVSA